MLRFPSVDFWINPKYLLAELLVFHKLSKQKSTVHLSIFGKKSHHTAISTQSHKYFTSSSDKIKSGTLTPFHLEIFSTVVLACSDLFFDKSQETDSGNALYTYNQNVCSTQYSIQFYVTVTKSKVCKVMWATTPPKLTIASFLWNMQIHQRKYNQRQIFLAPKCQK